MVSRNEISDRFVNICNVLISIGEVKSMQECADRLGTYPHIMSKIQKKQRPVPIEILLKMINKFNVRPGYLFGETEGANVFFIRETVQAGRTIASEYGDMFNGEHGIKSLKIAGLGGHKWVFTIEGDSMAPTLDEGDIVVCERLASIKELKSNAIYVVVSMGKPMVKRVEMSEEGDVLKLSLISDNPDENLIKMEVRRDEFIEFYEVKSRIIEQVVR